VPLTEGVRARMRSQRARDTAPEIAIRRLLHLAGLRYRVDVAPEPGLRRRADIVFTRTRVAVFVDGCFWHRCPAHGIEPRNNADWWRLKLDRNVARDRHTDETLSELGWTVLRIWEHESPAEAAERIRVAVSSRQR
jgi:DNA mismatch endonuclease (patch repair protein)